MSKSRGRLAATRHVRDLIRLSGCDGAVKVARVEERSKHFVFVLEGPHGDVTRLTLSHGGGSRATKGRWLMDGNLHAIRSVAGLGKVA